MTTIKYGQFNKLTVDQAIEKAILSVSHGQKLVQVAAVKIIIHTAKHGDYTKAQVLIDGLGEGIRKDSLVEWFKLYGLTADDKGFTGFDKVQVKDIDNLNKAKDVMWWTVKRAANPFKGFNLVEQLEKLDKQATKMQAAAESMEDEEAAKIVIDLDMQRAIRLIANGTISAKDLLAKAS